MAGRSGAAAIGGGIAGVAIDEIFFVGPRVRRAREIGQAEGWNRREAELRPYISALEVERDQLRARLQSSDSQLAGAKRLNEGLQRELNAVRQRRLPAPR